MPTTTKPKRPKPRTLKPVPQAFPGEPCEHCGCEWRAPMVNLDTGESFDGCANQWCDMVQQLVSVAATLAKLAADTPQFDNPLHVAYAQKLRDHVLAGGLRPRIAPRPSSPEGV